MDFKFEIALRNCFSIDLNYLKLSESFYFNVIFFNFNLKNVHS
jgi:hypothetical protein